MHLSDEYDKHHKLVYVAIYSLYKNHKTAENIAKENYMEFDDLVQIGNIVLLGCIKNNDNKTASFAHYVITSIKREIFFTLKYRGSLIAVPWNTQEEKKDLLSLDYEAENDETFLDFLPITNNVEKSVIKKITLEEKLNCLNDKYRQVISYKLKGLNDIEIAEIFGTTNRAISLVVNKALKKINPEAKMQRRMMVDFIELYELGLSKQEIMKKLQITPEKYRNYKWRYKKKVG